MPSSCVDADRSHTAAHMIPCHFPPWRSPPGLSSALRVSGNPARLQMLKPETPPMPTAPTRPSPLSPVLVFFAVTGYCCDTANCNMLPHTPPPPPIPLSFPPVTLLSPSKPSPPKYPMPAISTRPVLPYVCSSAGKVLGIVRTSGDLDSATAACNHRISTCIIDYESSENNGYDGGCIAQLQGKLSVEGDNNCWQAGATDLPALMRIFISSG